MLGWQWSLTIASNLKPLACTCLRACPPARLPASQARSLLPLPAGGVRFRLPPCLLPDETLHGHGTFARTILGTSVRSLHHPLTRRLYLPGLTLPPLACPCLPNPTGPAPAFLLGRFRVNNCPPVGATVIVNLHLSITAPFALFPSVPLPPRLHFLGLRYLELLRSALPRAYVRGILQTTRACLGAIRPWTIGQLQS